MFGYPQILNDNGMFNAGAGLHGDTSMLYSLPQGRRTFYSIRDGNWTDPTIWQTVQGDAGIPSSIDDVYVLHVVSTNQPANTLRTIKNLFVTKTGRLRFTGGGGIIIFSVENIKSYGDLEVTGQAIRLSILGNDNFIANIINVSNLSLTIQYDGNIDQQILDIVHPNIAFRGGSGNKYLVNDLTVLGNLSSDNMTSNQLLTFDLRNYSLFVTGTSTIQAANFGIRKDFSGGSVIFNGQFVGASISNYNGVNILGDDINIEFRGGINFSNYPNGQFNFGSNVVKFTNNNQTIIGTNSTPTIDFNFNVLISSGITLTANFIPSGESRRLTFNGVINGEDSTSTLINTGFINFGTQNAAENSMTVGVVNLTTTGTTVEFNGNYSATIPSRFSNFHNLRIVGTGTKTISTNTVLNGNLSISDNNSGLISKFELLNYNLTVNGTTTISNSSSANESASISATGNGNILFVGLLNFNLGIRALQFSGNPNVECRGGITFRFNQNIANAPILGNGTWYFNGTQTITSTTTATDDYLLFDGPVLIGNNTILTNGTSATQNVRLFFRNSVNGLSSTSSIINRGTIGFDTDFALNNFMTTGTWDFLTHSSSTVEFRMNSSITLPSTFTTFRNLRISNNGVATLSTNLYIDGNLTITDYLYLNTPVLELSNFDLTVIGNTSISRGIQKSGGGNVIFGGLVSISPVNSGIFNFSGNPNVEFRNGFSTNRTNNNNFNTGTGVWRFTTNNQSIFNSLSSGNLRFDCQILIDDNITLTVGGPGTNNSYTFTNTINGIGVNSTLMMGINNYTLNYQNSATPMSTGILDTSTNLNTFIYGNGNQNIKGGTYRNLTLNGGGTKTLQGNVSVQNTYTLTPPATLNNNGFTLTNP